MSKSKASLVLDEFSGDKYPDLMAAQRLALPAFVNCLEPIIRELLDSGDLVILDGRIIPNPDRKETEC